jgi:hypothetical protein
MDLQEVGLIWLSTATGDGSLRMRQWTSTFHKIRCISWKAKDLLASYERFCSLQLIELIELWKKTQSKMSPWGEEYSVSFTALALCQVPLKGNVYQRNVLVTTYTVRSIRHTLWLVTSATLCNIHVQFFKYKKPI